MKYIALQNCVIGSYTALVAGSVVDLPAEQITKQITEDWLARGAIAPFVEPVADEPTLPKNKQ
jgi:carbonic anhydrase/acetyltransferase-like protein (isoleucine patch superfamily)